VDVDGDGTFARTIDRIDATGIGLFVLPRPVGCDIDGNGAVNRLDINAILAVLGTSATPGDARDANGDGRITIADARACTLKCTQPRCEP
jgi:hypothetical protein